MHDYKSERPPEGGGPCCNLRLVLEAALRSTSGRQIDSETWAQGKAKSTQYWS